MTASDIDRLEKTCTKCGVEKCLTEFSADKRRKGGIRSWCKECDRAYDRAGRDKLRRSERRTDHDPIYAKEYRESHRDERGEYDRRYRDRHPERPAAKNVVQGAVRRGFVVRGSCEATGDHDGPVQAHHDDYTRPLAIRWLCEKHHKELHHERWLADLARRSQEKP